MRWALRRERLVAAAALGAVAALAWGYLLTGAGMQMEARPPGAGGVSFLVVFGMWAVMMLAMMLPSAAPMILLHGAVARGTSRPQDASTGAFASGYVAVWTGFSVGAAALQIALHEAVLLSGGLRITGEALGGAVLVAAGLYQLTPLKHACLSRCRSPVAFLTRHWRPGAGGAFRMGLAHGVYCVGCCWMLMALLFVGGVMNLLWVGAITLAVLAEKVAPRAHGLARASGVLLTVWGAGVIWHALA